MSHSIVADGLVVRRLSIRSDKSRVKYVNLGLPLLYRLGAQAEHCHTTNRHAHCYVWCVVCSFHPMSISLISH